MYNHPYYNPQPFNPPPPPRKQGLSTLTIVLLVLGGFAVLGMGACIVVGGLVYLGAQAEDEPAPVPSGAAQDEPALGEAAEDEGGGADEPTTAVEENTASADTNTHGTDKPSKPASGTKWTCNASGSVRVCGFANVCNYQMVFGTGLGNDQFSARLMAKNACEGMARAKGSATVCVVTCSPR